MVSDVVGGGDIFVRPFSPSAAGPAGEEAKSLTSKWMVSNGGGFQPRWRADGKEILYLSPAGKLMSVEVNSSGASFQAGVPKPLFDIPIFGGAAVQASAAHWAVTPDGQRFLVNTAIRPNEISAAQITVVLNWVALLKQ